MAPQDTGISFQRWGYVFWVQGKIPFYCTVSHLITVRAIGPAIG